MSEAGFTIEIDATKLDVLRQKVGELDEAVKGDDIRLVMGAALKEAVRDHFYKLASDNQHHRTATRFGTNRTGLYLKAGDNTHDPELVPQGVSVSVDDPEHALLQRIFGGTISAKAGGFLTLPAMAETHGHRAGEFENLRMILFPRGSGALIDKDDKWVAYQTPIYFWLVRSVTQEPDPTVAPNEDEMLDAVVNQTNDYLDRLLERVTQ